MTFIPQGQQLYAANTAAILPIHMSVPHGQGGFLPAVSVHGMVGECHGLSFRARVCVCVCVCVRACVCACVRVCVCVHMLDLEGKVCLFLFVCVSV